MQLEILVILFTLFLVVTSTISVKAFNFYKETKAEKPLISNIRSCLKQKEEELSPSQEKFFKKKIVRLERKVKTRQLNLS